MNVDKICIFCPENNIKYKEIIIKNKYWYVAPDLNPASNGHLLIIPKKHIRSLIQLNLAEWISLYFIIHKALKLLQKLDLDKKITGYNFGWNEGISAGQTVDHFHFHIIPRRDDDDSDPVGGIRKCVTDRGNYRELIKQGTNKLPENIFDRLKK